VTAVRVDGGLGDRSSGGMALGGLVSVSSMPVGKSVQAV